MSIAQHEGQQVGALIRGAVQQQRMCRFQIGINKDWAASLTSSLHGLCSCCGKEPTVEQNERAKLKPASGIEIQNTSQRGRGTLIRGT